MASPQPTDSHTRLSNELFTEILTRDFTKRQRAIIDLIIRLSYGCGHSRAIIPAHKYFEICGVQQKKVYSELRTLRELGVLDWDADSKEYWLIKDYETWGIPAATEQIKSAFNDVLYANIKHHQNGGNELSHPQNDGKLTRKMTVPSPPKRGQEIPDIPGVATDEAMPITKFITKDKESSTATTHHPLNSEQAAALKTLHSFLKPKSDDAEWILAIADQYPKVDLADAAWNLKMWLQERPAELNKKTANHRTRFRNFVKGDHDRKKWRKAHSRIQTHSNDESDLDKRIREALA